MTERAIDDWPDHRLPREVASTGRIRYVGHQRYHQLVVSMEDAKTRGRLVGMGYRCITIYGDPQDPRKDRRGVYQRQVPEGQEADGDQPDGPPYACVYCGHRVFERRVDGFLAADGVWWSCARCACVHDLRSPTYNGSSA